MRKFLVKLTLLLFIFGKCPVTAQTSMTDSQVMEYVKQAIQAGKDQSQIAIELAAKGVTQEQAKRVKENYLQQAAGGDSKDNTTNSILVSGDSRLRNSVSAGQNGLINGNSVSGNLLTDSGSYYLQNQEIQPYYNTEDQVFGRNIFNSENLSFEPNMNLATPQSYRLGPGMRLSLIFGVQARIR